jgi:hypothetical protein
MGATPDRQLALNFLSVVHDLWLKYPDTYSVEEVADDLVPALAQMCIKALAGDIRDGLPARKQQEISIEGSLMDGARLVKGDGAATPLNLRDVVNKIIHGAPTFIVVRDGVMQLHFQNRIKATRPEYAWTEAWFSGTQLLQLLGSILYKHDGDRALEREREIARFLEALGPRRFLPTSYAGA